MEVILQSADSTDPNPSSTGPPTLNQPESPNTVEDLKRKSIPRVFTMKETPQSGTSQLEPVSEDGWKQLEEERGTGCCNYDVKARLLRFLLISLVPIAMLFVMNELTDGGTGSETPYLNHLVGITVAGLYTVYFATLALQLHTKNQQAESHKKAYLFKVQTRLTSVDNWAKMRIAKTQLMFPLRPIQSISEFSAISGGQANQMIANLGPISWVALVMMYAAHMQCFDGSDYHFDVTDILIVTGVRGIVMIVLFELNHFDQGMIAG